MARRKKPPGFEKWTWREIDAGRKMSKTEKRYRRMAVGFGAKEKPGGKIEHTAESFLLCLLVFLFIIALAIFLEMSK